MDVSALIGVIMPAGIVADNGIVLIDAANQLRIHDGLDRVQAAAKAARNRSFRQSAKMICTALKCNRGEQ